MKKQETAVGANAPPLRSLTAPEGTMQNTHPFSKNKKDEYWNNKK